MSVYMLSFGSAIAAATAILVALKRRFAAKAHSWPSANAKIECVFVDYFRIGHSAGYEESHVVLGYVYSIDGSFYSGQAKLTAGDIFLEAVRESMVGHEITIHYDPARPEISIFLKQRVRGWDVMADPRISLSSWLSTRW